MILSINTLLIYNYDMYNYGIGILLLSCIDEIPFYVLDSLIEFADIRYSQKVWGSILAATKIVRCKNLAFNIGECVSRGSGNHEKAVGPMYIRRVIPEHLKDPRAPVGY